MSPFRLLGFDSFACDSYRCQSFPPHSSSTNALELASLCGRKGAWSSIGMKPGVLQRAPGDAAGLRNEEVEFASAGHMTCRHGPHQLELGDESRVWHLFPGVASEVFSLGSYPDVDFDSLYL
jgi:hypothetical protein